MLCLWAAGGIVNRKISALLCFASFVSHRTCGNECWRHHRGARACHCCGLSSFPECVAIRYEHPYPALPRFPSARVDTCLRPMCPPTTLRLCQVCGSCSRCSREPWKWSGQLLRVTP